MTAAAPVPVVLLVDGAATAAALSGVRLDVGLPAGHVAGSGG